MTSEIAILNREAVALAADSAVTIGTPFYDRPKVFPSANKLFPLSEVHPVGVMVYGNATLIGTPWETIIKIYRKKLGREKFDTIEEYAEDFVKFLSGNRVLFPEFLQLRNLKSSVYGYFSFMLDEISEEVQSLIENEGIIHEDKEEIVLKDIIMRVIEKHYNIWINSPRAENIDEDFEEKIKRKYEETFIKLIQERFEKLPIPDKGMNKLVEIATLLFTRFPEEIVSQGTSGIVIAGFGENEVFPSLVSLDVECIIEGQLKYRRGISYKIGEESGAAVIPFAQRDMIDTFMGGIAPNYIDAIKRYMSEVLGEYTKLIISHLDKYNKKEKQNLVNQLEENIEIIIKDLIMNIERFREEKYAQPILAIVGVLPKDELAALAESLVHLTSLRHRYTPEVETVGGPIDVAVISKGDGFIWIKRKQYFKPELNYHIVLGGGRNEQGE